jgi:hypothetical protein
MILLLFSIPIIVVLAESLCLTPLVIVTAMMTPILTGYWIIDQSQGANVTVAYVGGLLCLLCGYYVPRLLLPASCSGKSEGNVISQQDSVGRALRILIAVVFAFVIYHLMVGGIPLFSADPEIARFDVTSSGLFGIPSRMFLFGLPFVVLMTTVASMRNLVTISGKMLNFIWVCYFISSAFSGFKSSLFTVVIIFLFARSAGKEPVRVKWMLSARGLIAVGSILGSVFYVGSLYGSLRFDSLAGFEDYFLARSTVIAAEPGYYALTDYGTAGRDAVQYQKDFRFYFDEYLPEGTQDDADNHLPLDKSVSSQLYGGQELIVSVTVGAFPEMFVNIGDAAYAGMFGLGVLFFLIYRKARSCRSVFGCGIYSGVLYWMCVYITNGNLIYYVFNLGFVMTMLYAVFLLARVAMPQDATQVTASDALPAAGR